jgi:hypothetical protein
MGHDFYTFMSATGKHFQYRIKNLNYFGYIYFFKLNCFIFDSKYSKILQLTKRASKFSQYFVFENHEASKFFESCCNSVVKYEKTNKMILGLLPGPGKKFPIYILVLLHLGVLPVSQMLDMGEIIFLRETFQLIGQKLLFQVTVSWLILSTQKLST